MSTFTPAETLRQNRPLLLAMEAIGWFHMAGKARLEFLKKQGGERVDYSYEKWHDQETPPFPWDNLLEWTRRLYGSGIDPNAWPGTFAEFTERHRQRHLGLLGLLQAAHGIVSGVEKNLPGNTSRYLNQTLLHMWLSSPWGHPKRNLLAEPPEILPPQGWQQLVREIRWALEEARQLGTSSPSADVPAWKRWREQAIGEGSFIRRAFLSTLAETRLPNNDVTLWDQSYVAAALFKSAVAGALLASTNPNSSFPWAKQDIQQIAQNLGINLSGLSQKDRDAYLNGFIKNNTRWRLLTVAIGTDHYEARSVKIGDWTGAWGAIQAFFDRTAELVEVDLAIGSLLYWDSNVAVFSFPGERFDETAPANWLNRWEEWLQEQAEAIAQDLDLETPPYVHLSKPTRSLVPIVQEHEEALKVVAVPVHKQWDVRWTTPSEARGHVCPVCRVRLNGDPTSKTRPCRVCRDRRHHRRDDWVQGRLGYDTIWFEEVADRNGRLALLTFSLDVEPWLSGERVDSLRAQAIPGWARFNPVLSEFWQRDESRRSYISNPISPDDLWDRTKNEIRHKFRNSSGHWAFPETDLFLANLQEGFRHFRRANPQQSGESSADYEERLWRTFYEQIVEDRAQASDWNSLTDDNRAAWLTHQLFAKLPSPGRVYRFWREAEEFFRDLLREFRQIASRSDNPWRVRRLVLIPKDKNGWKDLTLYDGRWRGIQLSLVYIRSVGGFVTASNLARLLDSEEKGEAFLKGEKKIFLEDEDRSDQKETEIQSVRELGRPHTHLAVYAPVIPVSLSPLRFRVLVPLEVASECVDLAVTWWKERFARVWDRLPLRVGVIAFPHPLPYQAVVEAARNVEDALERQKEAYWQVVDIEKRPDVVALYLRHGDQTLHCLVPVTMPDGREDVFYPYVEVEDTELRFPRDFRHPDGHIFRHVADLQRGDGIKVAPSSVVTLLMDSTAARFRIPKPHTLDDWQHMRETWRLLLRVAPSTTALQRLRSAIAQLESSWRDPQGARQAPDDLRRETYRALLAHHLEGLPANALESLTQAAMEGLLTRALNWHLTALKESKEG